VDGTNSSQETAEEVNSVDFCANSKIKTGGHRQGLPQQRNSLPRAACEVGCVETGEEDWEKRKDEGP
jgi:hypothetical protein